METQILRSRSALHSLACGSFRSSWTLIPSVLHLEISGRLGPAGYPLVVDEESVDASENLETRNSDSAESGEAVKADSVFIARRQ